MYVFSNRTKNQNMRKPPNTDFYQQRLKAWHPILIPKYVFPIFFALGLILMPLGGLLFYFSSQVRDFDLKHKINSQKGAGNSNKLYVL